MNLLLMIKNPNALEKGTLPSHIFGNEGGKVGSDWESAWRLDNYAQTIKSEVFSISLLNGDFCLTAKDSEIYVNNSHKPLSLDSMIRLKTGDTIKAYNYIIGIKIIKQDNDLVTYEKELSDILGIRETLLLTAPLSDSFSQQKLAVDELLTLESYESIADPMLLLDYNASETKNDLMDFYDNQGIIPKTNLNESVLIADSQDVSRTDRLTVPMFVPKSLGIEPQLPKIKTKLSQQKEKMKPEEIKEILDPLELLDHPSPME